MNPDYHPSERLVDLIDSLQMRGKLSAPEAVELESMLSGDAAALEFYLLQQELHTMLEIDKAVRLKLASDLLPNNVIPMPGVVMAPMRKSMVEKAKTKPLSVLRAASSVVAMVAALVVLILIYSRVDEFAELASKKMDQLSKNDVRQVSFHDAVLPILTDHCFECHGESDQDRKGNLRLDKGKLMLERAESVIVPGVPEKSELIARISSNDPEFVMPPLKAQKSLSKDQIEIISRWVAQGAVFDSQWSFLQNGSKPERGESPNLN